MNFGVRATSRRRPKLARERKMDLIDRSQSRGKTPWDPTVQDTARMFGARAVDPILAAVMCDRINRPDIWPQSLRSEKQFRLLRVGGRPHMGPGSRFAWPGRRFKESATPARRPCGFRYRHARRRLPTAG